MIIKVVLIVAILIVIAWFLSNRTSHQVRAWQRLGVILLMLVGIVVVVSPDTANKVAHKLGVGRGADLLLYLLTLAFIFVVLNQYIKSKDENKKLAILTRKIALLEASQNKRKAKN